MDSLPSSPSKAPETLCILAARILLHPPARIPRPDDPTPRKPPAYVSGNSAKRKRDLSSTNLDLSGSSKRAKGKGRADNEDEQVRLARETMLYMPKPGVSLPRMLGRDVRPGRSTDEFKIPALPSRAQSQPVGKLNGSDVADVFGSVDSGSVKEKEHATDSKPGSDELEKANKTVIKQAAITCLSKHGVKKGHPEFNDLFTATYRGAAFALRNVVRVQAVNMRSVDKLLEAHARIYVNGNGDNHTSTSGS
ncbi:hypothetical protein EUX98_g8099 [Antrodiella citrinella]|uniref:Sld7 C-terminal domain-containing protein n=1 Tax=Antrodiella citrinella TaxID=2447956 RepID=A0A4S4MIS9_9APHY|nr:hypothetical protein EUX98_g8099 [Antrodiella citrinella]